METVKIEVRVTERTTEDGRKFNSYSTFSKNGRRTDLKFRAAVTNRPEKDCFIVCLVDDVNVNTSGKYPVCWVSAIQAIEELGVVNAERNRKAVTDYFG